MNSLRALQIAVILAGFVPVLAGAAGVVDPALVGLGRDTHAAYLSGLLLGIGLAFWSLVPSLAAQRRIFTLLTAIVMLGGLARLFLALRTGSWGPPVTLPLAMELGVTPLLCLWQRKISRPRSAPPRG